MKRCADGCKWCNIRWERKYCDLHKDFIANSGRYCKNFEPDNWLSKFLKWLF